MTTISPETQSDLYTLAQGPSETLFHDPEDLEQFGGDCHRLADDMMLLIEACEMAYMKAGPDGDNGHIVKLSQLVTRIFAGWVRELYRAGEEAAAAGTKRNHALRGR